MAISKIILNGVTQMDVTQDTVASTNLLSGYTATKNDGTQITGSYTPSSGGVDIPTFTVTYNSQTDVYSATCDTSYQACFDLYMEDMYAAQVDWGGETIPAVAAWMLSSPSVGEILYVMEDEGVPSLDILYERDGTITCTYPSSCTSTLNATANGTYTPSDGRPYREVTVAVPASQPTLQSKSKTYTPTTSQQTESVTADSGYDGLSAVNVTVNAMPSGTAGTPVATKGTVSNHSISVTPSVTNTAGYIAGGTETGTAVTVSASELVSGSETKTENGTYDVTNLASLVVNVAGTSKNSQIASGVGRVATTTYTAVSGQSINVAKTGKYNVYWTGYRSSISGTNGSRLYIAGSAYGAANTTFNSTYTNVQNVALTNVSLTAGQTVQVYARSRSTSYYMYIMNLTIIEV